MLTAKSEHSLTLHPQGVPKFPWVVPTGIQSLGVTRTQNLFRPAESG